MILIILHYYSRDHLNNIYNWCGNEFNGAFLFYIYVDIYFLYLHILQSFTVLLSHIILLTNVKYPSTFYFCSQTSTLKWFMYNIYYCVC